MNHVVGPRIARRGGEAREKLGERVGILDFDFAKANEINGFAIISRNRNDLASSDIRRRLLPFAGFCRSFYFNGARNGTRRETLEGLVPRDSRASIAWDTSPSRS